MGRDEQAIREGVAAGTHTAAALGGIAATAPGLGGVRDFHPLAGGPIGPEHPWERRARRRAESDPDPGATGLLGMTGGILGVVEGDSAVEAARGRHLAAERAQRLARARHDTTGAARAAAELDYADADATNGRFLEAQGATSILGGAFNLATSHVSDLHDPIAATRGTVNSYLGAAGAGLQAGQGGYNLWQAYEHSGDCDRSSQEAGDGALQLMQASTLVMGPLGAPAQIGMQVGGLAREQADAHAQATGILGTNRRGYRRGVPESGESETTHSNVTDYAAEVGMYERARHGDGAWGTAVGSAATITAATMGTAFSLAHAAGLATENAGVDHIIASDLDARGAGLANDDHSRVAEHRRAQRQQRDHRRAATAAAFAERRAAAGHEDVMDHGMNLHPAVPPTGHAAHEGFVPLAATGDSVERAALHMAQVPDLDAMVLGH